MADNTGTSSSGSGETYQANTGPLPAEKLQNQPEGKGALGNELSGNNYYSGSDRKQLVVTVQQMLIDLGYDVGEAGADGIFGKNTEKAVRQFQTDNKHWDGEALKVDGLVGPETADALNRKMVGYWYDHYQTPVTLTDGMPCHTVTANFLEGGMSLEPGVAEKALIFIAGVLSIARWERTNTPASMDDRRKMFWYMNELKAGQKVLFKVAQEGYGVIEEVEGEAEDGMATAVFSHWYQPKSVTEKVALKEGEHFPEVRFTFTASAPDIPAESREAPPLAYCDAIDASLEAADENGAEIKIKDCECILHSPRGTLACKTDGEGKLKIEKLPPGGVIVSTRSQVFIDMIKKS